MTTTWKAVWEARTLDPARGSLLAQLMAADGLDTGFGNVEESAWREYVEQVVQALGLRPGMSVFDVGCGAGAFLLPCRDLGLAVGGIDYSHAQITLARAALPAGQFAVAEASSLDTSEPFDAVVAQGVFNYFPSLAYAREVMALMVRKAGHALAILDISDADRRAQALRIRRGAMTEGAYAARYEGLDHLYIHRDWITGTLQELGVRQIRIVDQSIRGYQNSAYRFNILGRLD